ncbi:MAG TPA: GH92 family glycosyl hydrolase, partial [Ignavibacteriales bacterium]|nr:GH92 family glycosyl hydrolase [Ignavibacteriales bacterium]
KENPEEGYRSRFSHAGEKAEAGYYSVKLMSYNITAELTATKRCGFHKYTFPQSDKSNIIIDLAHGIDDSTDESWIEIIGKDQVRGFRKSSGWWAQDEYIYFHAKFSKAIDESYIHIDPKHPLKKRSAKGIGKGVKALLRFKTKEGEAILVKVGISAVSAENALANLNAEIPDWDFDKTRQAAAKAWDEQLSKIVVQGNEKQKRIFYTAMYRALLVPYLYMDVNGEYRGMDKKIYKADGFTRYTLFSLWDTFRAAHPLYSIIAPKENNNFIKTMLAMYDEVGRLPMWEMHTIETWGMSGYHSVPVIADAYLKGYGDFDIEKAFKAMKRSAEDEMLNDYKEYGYIPFTSDYNSVSTTLEYAYDDWCIAQVAKKLGKEDEYEYYIKRAQYYKNLFDTSTGFMRGKDSLGAWRKDFDPLYITPIDAGDFAEGNSWQYTFFVPQDVNGLIKLYGGAEKFAAKLDTLFSLKAEGSEESLDVSGLIGQYAHGNEPGHHTIYLYNYAGEAYKTQQRAHEIMATMYHDTRGGLPGNEDCGQMSAWYIFSALGFYPVNPAQGVYV